MLSVDICVSAHWDLLDPAVLEVLLHLADEGCIDGVLGGPSCSTWSVLRFAPVGRRRCARAGDTAGDCPVCP